MYSADTTAKMQKCIYLLNFQFTKLHFMAAGKIEKRSSQEKCLATTFSAPLGQSVTFQLELFCFETFPFFIVSDLIFGWLQPGYQTQTNTFPFLLAPFPFVSTQLWKWGEAKIQMMVVANEEPKNQI